MIGFAKNLNMNAEELLKAELTITTPNYLYVSEA
jgi:hypothetical protein